jgi:hypothetical protein
MQTAEGSNMRIETHEDRTTGVPTAREKRMNWLWIALICLAVAGLVTIALTRQDKPVPMPAPVQTAPAGSNDAPGTNLPAPSGSALDANQDSGQATDAGAGNTGINSATDNVGGVELQGSGRTTEGNQR